jgi:hypothetical protein
MHTKNTLLIIAVVATVGLTITASARQVFAALPGAVSGAESVVKADISHEQAVLKAAEERFPTPAIP